VDSAQALGFDYGKGRPGWHIECSAMSCQTLGETFDIHGGGADLQFPHHENEIAQSEGANRQAAGANSGCTTVLCGWTTRKMSKSLGNFFTIREVLAKYDAETVRFSWFARITAALNYSDVHLDDARTALKRLYTALDLVAPGALRDRLDRAFCGALQGGDGRGLRHPRGGGRAV
jgi:cysteinyl-tRNA synthetase